MSNYLVVTLLVFFSIGLALVGTISGIAGAYLLIESLESVEQYRGRGEGAIYLLIAAIAYGVGALCYGRIMTKAKA